MRTRFMALFLADQSDDISASTSMNHPILEGISSFVSFDDMLAIALGLRYTGLGEDMLPIPLTKLASLPAFETIHRILVKSLVLSHIPISWRGGRLVTSYKRERGALSTRFLHSDYGKRPCEQTRLGLLAEVHRGHL